MVLSRFLQARTYCGPRYCRNTQSQRLKTIFDQISEQPRALACLENKVYFRVGHVPKTDLATSWRAPPDVSVDFVNALPCPEIKEAYQPVRLLKGFACCKWLKEIWAKLKEKVEERRKSVSSKTLRV